MGGFRCRYCGKLHDELPMHFGTEVPALWFTIPEAKREERVLLLSDICLIDEKHGIIVGNLEILPALFSETLHPVPGLII